MIKISDFVLSQICKQDLDLSKAYLQEISDEVLEVAFGDAADFKTITTFDANEVKTFMIDWPISLNDRRFLFAVFVYFDHLAESFRHTERKKQLASLIDIDQAVVSLAKTWGEILTFTKQRD